MAAVLFPLHPLCPNQDGDLDPLSATVNIIQYRCYPLYNVSIYLLKNRNRIPWHSNRV